MNINTRKFVPFCLSGVVECNLDKQGRILIPNSLKVYSEIEKDIVFIGMSHRIEIWSKANWDVYNNEVIGNACVSDGRIRHIKGEEMKFEHVSVLLNECIEGLDIKPNGTYVDGTLGGAGHASVICSHLSEKGYFIGIDQDNNALAVSKERLKEVSPKVTLVKSNFVEVKSVLEHLEIDKVDGMLIDLGVSSHQLDEPSRGFSYMHDAPLDMRMNQDASYSAYEVVNTMSEEDLYHIIKDYGEERWAKRIANFIVVERSKKPIETTYELVEVIKKAIPQGARKDGPHPAKRTFQAIRIAVNRELEIIEPTIRDIVDKLNTGGRLSIITFHSLEDRIVKHTFKQLEDPCTCSKNLPVCVCGKVPQVKVITRKPILPSDKEIEANPRSRSAKLRIIEKI